MLKQTTKRHPCLQNLEINTKEKYDGSCGMGLKSFPNVLNQDLRVFCDTISYICYSETQVPKQFCLVHLFGVKLAETSGL